MTLQDHKRINLTRGYGFLENFLSRSRAKVANSLIPNELRRDRVLDIGCGKVPYFLLNTKFDQKFGIDPSIDTSKEHKSITSYKIAITENTKLPFTDDYFSVVTMQGVIGYFTAPQFNNLLKEIRRVLKPGGRIILTVPRPCVDGLLRVLVMFKLVSPEEMEDIISVYDKKTLASHFQTIGFQKDKIQYGYFQMFLNTWAYIDNDKAASKFINHESF